MRNSKLYTTLKSFDKIEQNRLRKFLSSPYFNSNQALIDLFEFLIREINQEKTTPLDKPVLWRILEPGHPFNNTRFRKYCSDLLKLTEDYLAQEAFEGHPTYKAICLMEAVGKKKLEKLFNGALKNANSRLEKQPYRDTKHYHWRYEIERNYSIMSQAYLNRSSISNLDQISRNLDIFYVSEKLRLSQEIKSIQDKLAYQDYDFPLLRGITQQLGNYDYGEVPAISLYYQIFLISETPENEDHYYRLKSLLGKHALLFNQEEAYHLYNAAMNYCINKINKGNQKYLSELFDLYNDTIEKEIIFVGGEISPWDFRNIVVLALRLGHYGWTQNFIEKYNFRIAEKFRNNAVSFNMATLHFYQRQYDKVIELLQTVEYEDFSYNLNSKAMLLATYYETEEFEPLYSLFESFRAYLNRNKNLPESRKNLYKNLIKFTKKLTKITPGDKNSLKKLRQEIEQTKDIASAGWLKEKISELE